MFLLYFKKTRKAQMMMSIFQTKCIQQFLRNLYLCKIGSGQKHVAIFFDICILLAYDYIK